MSEGTEFQPGDVVELKSGGPKMTVQEYGEYAYGTQKGFKCVWFEKQKRNEEIFAAPLLKKTE